MQIFSQTATMISPYLPSLSTLKAGSMAAKAALTSTTGLVLIGALALAYIAYKAINSHLQLGKIEFDFEAGDVFMDRTPVFKRSTAFVPTAIAGTITSPAASRAPLSPFRLVSGQISER